MNCDQDAAVAMLAELRQVNRGQQTGTLAAVMAAYIQLVDSGEWDRPRVGEQLRDALAKVGGAG